MIKYDSILVTFTEVPDEISLCINCTCCPLKCPGCFEPWLQRDCGKILTYDELNIMLEKAGYISCVCFMGGINDYESLVNFMKHIKYKGLKVALYSGHSEMNPEVAQIADFYKIGPYIQELGPLNAETTNQRFFKKENNNWIDITYKFQQKRV